MMNLDIKKKYAFPVIALHLTSSNVPCCQTNEDEARRGPNRQTGQHRGHEGELRGQRPAPGDQPPGHLALPDHAESQLM